MSEATGWLGAGGIGLVRGVWPRMELGQGLGVGGEGEGRGSESTY